EVEAEQILTRTFVDAFHRKPEPDAGLLDRTLLLELQKRFSLTPQPAAVLDPELRLIKTAGHRTDMEEALRLLPASERLVFLLKDVEGYSAAAIAGLLLMTEGEVQQTILSARIRMRNALAAAYKASQRGPAEQQTCLASNQGAATMVQATEA
ncbi:MAG TPA: sigma factor-like helix-turn-helix DNA-binding protein, partial [Acidobacteriaceae bacterium]